jgi:hypothetical protein
VNHSVASVQSFSPPRVQPAMTDPIDRSPALIRRILTHSHLRHDSGLIAVVVAANLVVTYGLAPSAKRSSGRFVRQSPRAGPFLSGIPACGPIWGR